jgi:hypothetical protein
LRVANSSGAIGATARVSRSFHESSSQLIFHNIPYANLGYGTEMTGFRYPFDIALQMWRGAELLRLVALHG